MANTAEDVLDDKALSESMDDDIRSTLAAINARNAEESAPAATEDAAGTASTEDVAPAADTRVRDESGKFVAKEKPAAPETAPQPSSEIEASAPVAAAPTEQALDLNRAPSSWKPAAKAQWAALPEDVRAEIYRRESDFHKGNSAIKENADFGMNIKSVVEPYRMLIEAEGGTPESAIRDTMRTAAIFRVGTPQQKMAAMYQIDQQFNCGFQSEFNRLVQQEVAKLTGQQAPQAPMPPQQFHDPRVDALLRSQEQEQQRRAQELSAQASDAENRFRAAVDDKGQPKFPFVDNVTDDMISRIPAIQRSNPSLSHFDVLQQAYEAAVWANPETRAVLLSQQQQQATRPAETLRNVEQARRASAVNVPKRGSLPATGPAKSIEETIRETGQALGMF